MMMFMFSFSSSVEEFMSGKLALFTDGVAVVSSDS